MSNDLVVNIQRFLTALAYAFDKFLGFFNKYFDKKEETTQGE